MYRSVLLALTVILTGCVSTYPIPEQGVDFTLDRCTPFLNCVSSESVVFLYKIDSIALVEKLTPANWQKIQDAALTIQGATLKETRFGYLDMVCKSSVIGFPDYFEVLVEPDQRSLAVRSQSLLGLYDMGVNRNRVETFRKILQKQGIAKVVKAAASL
ncbi:DUF1499 domain-containing protein [Reinekea sp.]|jgi:uncharacterized protein (DUF1499 family)|uniref:DUF1499 domain-containing protein n=1 Tax=Reinekea sp. TaxID=1970455 RepID=UPI003989A7D5